MDQSSWDDTLVDVGPPRPSPGDAVSSQSSRDKRTKRSPEKTSRGEGKAISARIQHPSPRRLVVATLLVAPGAVFVTANLLQYGLGVEGVADWLDPLFAVSGVAWLVTALLLAGPVAAMLLAASRLLPIRLVRDGDAWEVRIRVRADRWAIAVAALSLLVGGILAAHLVAENLACVIGLRSTC